MTDSAAINAQAPFQELPINAMPTPPLNQILYGPPGTGKTYATVTKALEILDPQLLAQVNADASLDAAAKRKQLKQRFDELHGAGRLQFTTFHQSFSYEDFVEGIRAVSDEDTKQLSYPIADGVFKQLCDVAQAKATQVTEQDTAEPYTIGKRTVWKMSLGNTLGETSVIYDECASGGYVLLGYGRDIDFSDCKDPNDVKARYATAGVVLDGPYDYNLISVVAFVTKMKAGDLIVVSDGNLKFRAIAEVTGGYEFVPHPNFEGNYSQKRKVKWLRRYSPSLPHTELLEDGKFTHKTLYSLPLSEKDKAKLHALLSEDSARTADFHVGQMVGNYKVLRVTEDVLDLQKPSDKGTPLQISMQQLQPLIDYVRSGELTVEDIRNKQVFEKIPNAPLEKYLINGYQNVFTALVAAAVSQSSKAPENTPSQKPHVLIIDEINRGNVSRIFGELITLIEPSKRAGMPEALSVTLPYSKQPFSVPNNVHIIGTMNTTDRSLAGLDIALRRRFVFEELTPNPEVLRDIIVSAEGHSVNIGTLLHTMNERIEALIDREHQLGHAYFMPLHEAPTLEVLAGIFKNQILPLLQEYFFDDWERIAWVLNDHRKQAPYQFIQKHGKSLEALFGADHTVQAVDKRWLINPQAFESLRSFAEIISTEASFGLEKENVGGEPQASTAGLEN